MAKKRSQKLKPEKWYSGANIPMRVIRDFARRVAERFQPEKIILFGSYAYGTPHEDSDVDILVVMKARSQLRAALQHRRGLRALFPSGPHCADAGEYALALGGRRLFPARDRVAGKGPV